jgi:hypothetical protein
MISWYCSLSSFVRKTIISAISFRVPVFRRGRLSIVVSSSSEIDNSGNKCFVKILTANVLLRVR